MAAMDESKVSKTYVKAAIDALLTNAEHRNDRNQSHRLRVSPTRSKSTFGSVGNPSALNLYEAGLYRPAA